MKRIHLFSTIVLLAAARLIASAQSDDEKFDKLTTDFFKGYFLANPIVATQTGVHDYDNLIDDLSPTAIELEVKRLTLFKQKLADINATSLSKDKNIDYRILDENIDESLFNLGELKSAEWNPMDYTGAIGNSIASLIYQEFAPLDQRLKNAVERAKQVPKFLEQAKANLKNAPKIHVETAIRQNQGNIGLFKDELPAAAKNASPQLQNDIQSASATAIAALEDFGKWLEKDLLPHATKDTRLGKEIFTKKLLHALKSSLTPDQVLQRAEAEKNRVHD
ncbi:MAG: DUF885 family protein, partial [Ignavibacteriales bacterium]|nr:DUF885 family protein [Ignavibacteriales bacterium]